MTFVNIAEIFEKMSAAFAPEKAANAKATIQFDITGPNGGKWFAKIENGACQVEAGELPNADLTLTAADDDYLAMMNGTINPMTAFMMGKIKAKGNMTLAMGLTSWFNMA